MIWCDWLFKNRQPVNILYGGATSIRGQAPPVLKIDRGIFLRVYPLVQGPRRNWRQMRQRFNQAVAFASMFVPEMFMGYDPTGWNRQDMMLYRADLHITSAGNYTFAFDVADVGFLNLNGKNLLTKTRPGGMMGRVRFKRTIYLKPGWYPMTVGELHLWWLAGISVDWKPPGSVQYALSPLRHLRRRIRRRSGDWRRSAAAMRLISPLSRNHNYLFRRTIICSVIHFPHGYRPRLHHG